MANSRAGNYQLEFTLTGFVSPTRIHKHSIYVAPTSAPTPGTPVASVTLQQKGGGTTDLQSAANTYSSFMRLMYATSIAVTQFTLWRYITHSSRQFITAGTAVPTTVGAGGVTVAWQNTLTYRTAGGSIMKQLFLETNTGGNDYGTLTPSSTGNAFQRMAAYLLSVGGIAVGIDNTFPIKAENAGFEENEFWQGKIYRPA